MSFTGAFDAATAPQRRLGENGSVELTAAGVGDDAVALFFALVRGCTEDRVAELMRPLLSEDAGAVQAFVLAFQTRHCRGGKGERLLFRSMWSRLVEAYPVTCCELVPHLPHFGSYNDWVQVWQDFEEAPTAKRVAVQDAIVKALASQLRADAARMAGKEDGARKASTSLAAKWAPREGKSGSAMAKRVAAELFGDSRTARAQYRRLVSSLNKHLGTAEVRMCAGAWGEVDPTAVPSSCMLRNRKAFLNEQLRTAPTGAELETGNRKPEDAGRVLCRKRVREALTGAAVKKLKGKQLFPHELVKLFLPRGRTKTLSSVEVDVLDAQWAAIREDTLRRCAEGGGTLGRTVALVDVSGSMQGTPLEVAVALGILVSECAAPDFANRVITFHSTPTWFKLEEGASIKSKVEHLCQAPWGMTTDFAKAMDLILQVCVEAKLQPDEIPNLLVLSDMQFDRAHEDASGWETQHERIVRRFEEEGLKATGKPWPAPQITYWNVRGDTRGFPAAAGTDNVKLLSGFSPSLLKNVLDGSEEEVTEVLVDKDTGETTVRKLPVDPRVTLARVLEDEAYDPVRAVLAASTEGRLKSYSFTPAPPADDSASVVTRSSSTNAPQADDDGFVLLDT